MSPRCKWLISMGKSTFQSKVVQADIDWNPPGVFNGGFDPRDQLPFHHPPGKDIISNRIKKHEHH